MRYGGWRLTMVLWVKCCIHGLHHVSKCNSNFKDGWNIQLVLMFLSVVLKMGMWTDGRLCHSNTTERQLSMHADGFFATSDIQISKWTMNSPRWIRLCVRAVSVLCNRVQSSIIIIVIRFAFLFAIWLTKVLLKSVL